MVTDEELKALRQEVSEAKDKQRKIKEKEKLENELRKLNPSLLDNVRDFFGL